MHSSRTPREGCSPPIPEVPKHESGVEHRRGVDASFLTADTDGVYPSVGATQFKVVTGGTGDAFVLTQNELIRAEKLATVGELVAGVAHELNTPLGNGLMSVSLIHDEVCDFRVAMQSPPRPSQLTGLIDKIETASDIATRNITRAAELVASFKQVAIDQTSSQRRRFDLRELIDEILLTLRPTTTHFPVAIRVRVAPGLVFDSYPGPLGQVITNLVSNALRHGFDGRDEVNIHIDATPIDESNVRLDVIDDGVGIADDLLERVFDPFVTSRAGSSGTGLGLHISHNAVVNVLGGEIGVRSAPNQGTTFSMRLPLNAPDVSSTAK